jgi:hypothetical protein
MITSIWGPDPHSMAAWIRIRIPNKETDTYPGGLATTIQIIRN